MRERCGRAHAVGLMVWLALALAPAAIARSQETVASRLIAQARQHIEDINPDSAATLLQQALDPRVGATIAEKLRAFVLYGVTELTAGRTDGARRAFREALALDPTLRVDSLAELHESLVSTFAQERTALGATARPVPGVLELRVVPAGARVAVNGVVWDDRRREVPPGVHRVEVSARGYLPYSDSIKVNPGTTLVRDIALVRLEDARLSVASVPWGIVYLDSERIGETPLFEQKVPAGAYTLRVESPSRTQPFVLMVELVPGQATSVAVPGAPASPSPPPLVRADSLYRGMELDSAVAAYRRVVWDSALTGGAALRAAAATRAAMAFSAMAAGRKDAALADSARAYFGVAFRSEPRYEPDSGEIGPEMRSAMEAARARVLGLVVEAPPDTLLPATGGRLVVAVRPTHQATVEFRIAREDGETLWTQTRDAAGATRFEWDYHLSDGALPSPGRYVVAVTARDAQGDTSPVVERQFSVQRAAVDTLPHPPAPSETDFLPETVRVPRGGPGVLLAGAAIGAGTLMLEGALGNSGLKAGTSSGTGSYIVAGSVTVAAVIGFLAGHRTRGVPENVLHNAQVRAQYRLDRDATIAENARRRQNAGVRFRFDEAP
jgi:hypothetical protein